MQLRRCAQAYARMNASFSLVVWCCLLSDAHVDLHRRALGCVPCSVLVLCCFWCDPYVVLHMHELECESQCGALLSLGGVCTLCMWCGYSGCGHRHGLRTEPCSWCDGSLVLMSGYAQQKKREDCAD
eukprot:scaffold235153_cov21-Tisochrysis_lutea.AAC.1